MARTVATLVELGGCQEACLSPDELREESVAAGRDTCFQELGCKAAVGAAGGHQWRDRPPQRTVFITGEPAVGLNTRDRDQPWGPRGMKRERREEMGGSHGFARGDRISWGAGMARDNQQGRACGQTEPRHAAAPFCQLSLLREGKSGQQQHMRMGTGVSALRGRDSRLDGKTSRRAGGAARTPGRGLREPARGPWTGA